MRDVLSHRGPDGSGSVIHRGVGLAHRRLSIIDVEGGAQPLSNEDGTVWVTFNGEIYNFHSLRADLIARGHRFRTRCDTEVLVHLYEEYGDSFAERLNGIFAFAIHDRRRDRVLLVRDQLGVKPLFYKVHDGTLLFGSEMKAVIVGTEERPRIDPQALQEYLVFRYICAPRTFVEDIRRLEPGHLATWERGRLEVRPYWRPPAAAPTSIGFDEAVEELDRRLGLAVERQLMSDVPLGVFCSGGVDSGLVTGYASRISGGGLASFSYGLREAAWDETELATDSARRAGTTHQVLMGGADEFLEWTKRLMLLNDEPLSHPNSVPLAQLSEFARRSVKVVLTGEGADELFCGYPRYRIARLHARFDHVPRPLMSLLGGALGLLPDHRMRKLADLLPRSTDDQQLFNSAFVSPEQVERLTGSSLNGALDERRDALVGAQVAGDALQTLSRYESATYLVSALERLDRVSMAVGLEARVPLLDIELVEWAMMLPSRVKISNGRSKAVLKSLAERSLSPRITSGPKSGFGLPLDEWFRTPAYQPLLEPLGDPGHPAASLLDREEVGRISRSHSSRRGDHGELLWLLSNVYLWHETEYA